MGTATTTPGDATVRRVERLNAASSRRTVDPDTDLPWGELGDGQLMPDELLTTAGLGVDLDAAARRRLANEEVASMLAMGVRFEAVLCAGFARMIAEAPELADPRITYMLHEVGEETRHSRAFLRVIEEIPPQTRNPFDRRAFTWALHRITRRIAAHDTLLLVMTLAGEEIPDLLQRLVAEHPDSDPMLVALNRYHRQEEARHLSYARAVLSESWTRTPRWERAVVRHVVPGLVAMLWQNFVHPGVYAAAGLPTWPTWRAIQRLPRRIELRRVATRPVLTALIDAGAVTRGRVPRAWRRLCGVDRHGVPVT